MIQEKLNELVEFVMDYADANPDRNKDDVAAAVERRFGLVKQRKVYVGPDFAVRFSQASTSSFSNTVLSLSALKRVDDRPMIVCVVRQSSIQLLLANSTLLKRISHSSQRLRVDNVRGSFNGSDIVRVFAGLPNVPNNFEELFVAHQQFSWEDNVARLAESTGLIVPSGKYFEPAAEQRTAILGAPQRAADFSASSERYGLHQQLDGIVHRQRAEILRAAHIDNVNTRGNTIEQIVTSAGNFHGCEDMSFALELGYRVYIDVKTKLLGLASNPKAYNIDKFLKTLTDPAAVFLFFFVGIDVSTGRLRTALVSPLDSRLLSATRIQFHWAGRNSRGVTQLDAAFTSVFDDAFEQDIDLDTAKRFLSYLLSITPNTEIDE